MKSLSSKVYKNHQINLGIPFLVKVPVKETAGVIKSGEGHAEKAGYGVLFGDGDFDSPGAEVSGGTKGAEKVARVAGAGGADAGSTGGGAGAGSTGGGAGTEGAAYADGNAELSDAGTRFESDAENEADEPVDPIEAAAAEADRIVRDATEKGREIIAKAKDEADAILRSAKIEADTRDAKMRDKAAKDAAELHELARREGELEGRKEGREAYDSLIAEAERIRADAQEKYRKLLTGAEGDMLELVLKISRKVIGDEIAFNRNSIISMIRDAFDNCTNKDDVVLKISPEDYDFVIDNKNNLLSMIEGIDNLEIRRDLSLGPGSCSIETAFGNLDAGADMRLSKIEDAFYRILSASRPMAGELIA